MEKFEYIDEIKNQNNEKENVFFQRIEEILNS